MTRHAVVFGGAVACLIRVAWAADDGGSPPAERGEAEEEIVVLGRLPQLPLPPSRVPARVHVIAADPAHAIGTVGLPRALADQVPGLSLSDEQGNSYQPDLSMRGFTATSVTGVPQGVSVFLDGVRVNEATAEEINFDLLPTDDLERVEVVPGPSVLFGRNTLAGAITLFTGRGKDGGEAFAEVTGGSAGFRKLRARLSGRQGPVDVYLSGSDTREDGWREATNARLTKVFAKLGLTSSGTDLTLSYQHADNRIEQAGPLPTSELAHDPSANYTAGDFFAPRLDQLALNARRELGADLSVSANAFGRLLHVEQFNVNVAAANSRLLSRSGSAGATLQIDSGAPLFGRWNQLSGGLEYAHTDVEVSVFTPEDLETKVHDRQDAAAAYLQDTFRLARRVFGEQDEAVLTAALRWDWVGHRIDDQSPAAAGRENASGAPAFRRLDPLIGLNYNLTREHGIYLSWSQGFRAPALLELTCAGPAAICPGLQAGTAPDPPLSPVRATNYEIGLRTRPSQWLWAQASAYRTDVADDIFSVSPGGTTGVYFQNIGKTRRQGIEADVRARPVEWLDARLGYAWTDARFEEEVILATPRRVPGCDAATCSQHVAAGSELPLVPRHRGRAEVDVSPARWLSLSLGATFVGSQYLRGDEENATARLDGYFTVDGAVRVTAGGLVVWTRLGNLLGATYSSFGTYAANAKLPGTPVERFLTPGRPFTILAGVSYAMGSGTTAAR